MGGHNPRSYTYTCLHCGKLYHPKQKDRNKYCSRECRFNYLHERKAKRLERIKNTPRLPGRLRTCPICNKEFRSKREVYCSEDCRKEQRNRDALVYDKLKYPGRNVKCRQCGREYHTEYGDKNRIFCSLRCRKKYSRRDRDNGNRQRARHYGCVYVPVKAIVIFERDGWTCRICGKSTPKRLRGTFNNRAPELDHIIPLSLGGSHTPINLQCSCRLCNIEKSNKAQAQLRLV